MVSHTSNTSLEFDLGDDLTAFILCLCNCSFGKRNIRETIVNTYFSDLHPIRRDDDVSDITEIVNYFMEHSGRINQLIFVIVSRESTLSNPSGNLLMFWKEKCPKGWQQWVKAYFKQLHDDHHKQLFLEIVGRFPEVKFVEFVNALQNCPITQNSQKWKNIISELVPHEIDEFDDPWDVLDKNVLWKDDPNRIKSLINAIYGSKKEDFLPTLTMLKEWSQVCLDEFVEWQEQHFDDLTKDDRLKEKESANFIEKTFPMLLEKDLRKKIKERREEERREIEIEEKLESHYETLINNLRERDIVPFLGADINLCDRPESQASASPWNWDRKLFPPTNVELAAYIIHRCNDHYLQEIRCPLRSGHESYPNSGNTGCPLCNPSLITRLDLQHITQFVQTKETADIVRDSIQFIYNQNREYKPNTIHKFFANLTHRLKNIYSSQGVLGYTPHLLIVTTCFDRMLERAFEDLEPPQAVDLVSYVSQNGQKKFVYQKLDYSEKSPDKMTWTVAEEIKKTSQGNSEQQKVTDDPYNFLQERPVILRLYGPSDWKRDQDEKFAISEDQFLDYLTCDIPHKLPVVLWQKLVNSHLWFLGYSLSQWNLRGIVRQIQSSPECQGNNKEWWAIQERLELLDEKLWTRQEKPKVSLYTKEYIASFKQYIDGLDEKLKETKQ